MRKIISFSVWGNTNPRYRHGMLRNITLAKEYFPEWEIFVYTDEEWLNGNIYDKLTVHVMKEPKISGWFWRFLPFFEIEGYILSRDADSRLSLREKRAVDEWVSGGQSFNVIKDHIRHFDFPMLAGMWGARTPLPGHLLEKMNQHGAGDFYLADQGFLAKEIWPIAKNNVLIHQMGQGWFKETRDRINFVGQGYDENDKPIYSPE